MTDNLLGYVTWYSLSSATIVSLSELEKFREGVDPLIKLPKKPTKINLFKRVCKGFKLILESQEDGTESKYTISDKDIKFDGYIARKISVSVNKTNTSLGYVKFNTETTEVEFEKSGIIDEELWENIQTSFISAYSKDDTIDHMGLRSVIKDALEDKMLAVWLNSGTYFVEPKFFDKLVDLKNTINSLENDCVEMEIIPLLDQQPQREMLYKYYYIYIMSIEIEFFEKLASLPHKPTAYQVKKLESLIEQIDLLEIKASSFGENKNIAVSTTKMLEEKLNG